MVPRLHTLIADHLEIRGFSLRRQLDADEIGRLYRAASVTACSVYNSVWRRYNSVGNSRRR